MTKIKFTGATAIASNHEALTVGAVGLVVRFEFNSAWDGLNKIAVFHCGGVTKDVLGSSFPANICPIPWECLQEEGETLYCGVYGTDSNGKIIIPSKMARLGTVHPAADPTGDESLDPTLPVWQQALNMAQDAMSLLAGKVNRSGDTMQGDLNMGAHTLRLGSTTGMTEDNLNIIRLVADREEEGVTLRNIDTPYEDSDAVNKKYVDDTVGALNSVLYVNITQSGSAITGDKTYAEILAAVTANKCVIVKFADMNFYLDSVANDKIAFQRLNIGEDDESRKSIDKQLVCISNSDAWTVDADFVAVDTAMSDTSAMPVQNKVVKAYIDGITPTIGDNGNWYLGATDTGKPSRGEQGLKGAAGPAGDPGIYYGTTQPTGDTHPVWIDPSGDQDGGGLLPAVTAADNGKFLRVVSGAWAAATLPIYGGESE